jgi:hypothetical protein
MKQSIRIIAISISVLCAILSFLYILLLMFSFFISFPFEMEANVMFTDWFFLSVPILALLAGVLLQVASLGNKKGKKTVHK